MNVNRRRFIAAMMLLGAGCVDKQNSAPAKISKNSQPSSTAIPTNSLPATKPAIEPTKALRITDTPPVVTKEAMAQPTRTPQQNLPDKPLAPAIESDTWLNTQPLQWNELRGKVVMIEFWTFG
jgi:hypothetical protein